MNWKIENKRICELMFRKLILVVLVLFIMSTPIYANELAAYKLDNGRISVREDVFNRLVTNDKLLEEYKKELEDYKKAINQINLLEKQKDEIQEQRITVLKETISYKDDIITYKDKNLDEYEKLYNSTKKELNRQKTLSFFEKLLITALGGYAISEIDDNTAKAVVGAGIGTIWIYDDIF